MVIGSDTGPREIAQTPQSPRKSSQSIEQMRRVPYQEPRGDGTGERGRRSFRRTVTAGFFLMAMSWSRRIAGFTLTYAGHVFAFQVCWSTVYVLTTGHRGWTCDMALEGGG
jgi:hypothetical protein